MFDQLQQFLYEVDQCSNLDEVITQYTSSKGSKVDPSNTYLRRLKATFEDAYPEEKELLKSGIIHIHLKRNGKNKFVMFGIHYESVFFVLTFDPNHSFNKRA